MEAETAALPFHPHGAPDYYEHLISNAIEDGRIIENEGELIRKYVNSKSGVSALRKTKITQTLISWRPHMQATWIAADIDEIHAAINNLKSANSTKGKPYSRNTISDHIRVMKSFYRWLGKRKLTGITREDLEEIKAGNGDTETTKPGDLLTREEISKMIAACKTHRDKAIVALAYETGARIHELARLRWSDLGWGDQYLDLHIRDFKTGKTRQVPIIDSIEYLAAWRNGYYGAVPSGDVWLFVTTKNEPLEYRAISQIITRSAERAKIKKRVHPHLLRKSRITELVRKKYSDAVIKEVFWSNQSTGMYRVYVKLSHQDVTNEFLEKAGIKTPDEESDSNLPRQCKYCLAMNASTSEYCRVCFRPLTRQAVEETKDLGDVIAEFADMVRNKPEAFEKFLKAFNQ